MSIQGDVVAAIEAASIYANADYEPEDTSGEYVVVLRNGKEPTNTLIGTYDAPTKSTFALVCKAPTKAAASDLAVLVVAAIKASTLTTWFFEPVSEDEFEPAPTRPPRAAFFILGA
jgi:hypothetical protein